MDGFGTMAEEVARQGWARVEVAVPAALCARLAQVVETEVRRTDGGGAVFGEACSDLVPIWGHQAQWDIRQWPTLHAVWSELWGTTRLFVSLDSCRFTPPWRPGQAEPLPLHWDHDPRAQDRRMFQGCIALTDTDADQGGFRCAPGLHRAPMRWPTSAQIDAEGDESWLCEADPAEIIHVPARAGDLIVWDSRLPHANSRNRAKRPRLVFYVQMGRRSRRRAAEGQSRVVAQRRLRAVVARPSRI